MAIARPIPDPAPVTIAKSFEELPNVIERNLPSIEIL
jgi:hypothetical protein